jgi:hypothetical protein
MKWLSAIAVVLLASCATAESGRAINRSAVDQFHEGVTTRAQVEALMGPPTVQTRNSDGSSMLSYNHVVSKANGMSGKVSTDIDVATFFFNTGGVLIRSSVTQSDSSSH